MADYDWYRPTQEQLNRQNKETRELFAGRFAEPNRYSLEGAFECLLCSSLVVNRETHRSVCKLPEPTCVMPFRCSCGGNVLTKWSDNVYSCNSCRAEYYQCGEAPYEV